MQQHRDAKAWEIQLDSELFRYQLRAIKRKNEKNNHAEFVFPQAVSMRLDLVAHIFNQLKTLQHNKNLDLATNPLSASHDASASSQVPTRWLDRTVRMETNPRDKEMREGVVEIYYSQMLEIKDEQGLERIQQELAVYLDCIKSLEEIADGAPQKSIQAVQDDKKKLFEIFSPEDLVTFQTEINEKRDKLRQAKMDAIERELNEFREQSSTPFRGCDFILSAWQAIQNFFVFLLEKMTGKNPKPAPFNQKPAPRKTDANDEFIAPIAGKRKN